VESTSSGNNVTNNLYIGLNESNFSTLDENSESKNIVKTSVKTQDSTTQMNSNEPSVLTTETEYMRVLPINELSTYKTEFMLPDSLVKDGWKFKSFTFTLRYGFE
jgi:hypothetical protein